MNHLFLTPKETAYILGVRVNTLAVWRCRNHYPELEYRKIGKRKVVYVRESVEQFLNNRKG